jgi:hypothetical protein
MVHQVEIAERRQIRTRSILTTRRHETHRPRYNSRNEQLVVECRWAVLGVGIDVDVGFLKTLAVVVGAVAGLPGWVPGLREVPVGLLAPFGAGGFDFFEVAVWVAFDGGFAVEHLLVGGGVFAALFFVGGHRGGGGEDLQVVWCRLYSLCVRFSLGGDGKGKYTVLACVRWSSLQAYAGN